MDGSFLILVLRYFYLYFANKILIFLMIIDSSYNLNIILCIYTSCAIR
nr:MAG TPA: hypothetical protein [Caudoviricetes sp.]